MSVTKQVGGNHYNSAEQHWDLMEEFDIGYLEANASKYVLRYDRKGTPLSDLGKAKSYIERLLESRTRARRLIPSDRLQQFCITNELSIRKAVFFRLVHLLGDHGSMKDAIELIDSLMEEEQHEER